MSDYFSLSGYNRQFPVRVISNQDILELGDEQQQTLIGHTLSYCNELETVANEAVSKAEEYYEELVAAGLKTRPKSTEELMQEQAAQQQEINASLLKTIQKLSEKIDKLEGNNNGLQLIHECSEQGEQGSSAKNSSKSRKQTDAGTSGTGS